MAIEVQCSEVRCKFNIEGICQARIVILAQDYGADEAEDIGCATFEPNY